MNNFNNSLNLIVKKSQRKFSNQNIYIRRILKFEKNLFLQEKNNFKYILKQ